MPKKKAADNPPVPEEAVPVDTATVIPEPMPSIVEASERVIFEGQHVAAILQDGRELRDDAGKITHYHCGLENGTTAHVPVTLFV